MKTMVSHIDLIIECRDYRVPLTSRNPLFEQLLQGRERLIVYTKRDLGVAPKKRKVDVDVRIPGLPQAKIYIEHWLICISTERNFN